MFTVYALVLAAMATASPISTASKRGGNWNLFRTYQGEDWFNDWEFVTFDDPTRGRTNYVDVWTARNNGLAWTTGTQFGMSPDTWTVGPGGRGRDSVRIHSKDWYGEVLIVADIQHMPDGCGTWPAFWTNGQGRWPMGGEFDIIEGVNGQEFNRVTLHTGSDKCVLPNQPWAEMSGITLNKKCVGGAGCTIEDRSPHAWGKGFNDVGGGWYVMRRDKSGYAVWFFPRNSASVPEAVRNGGDSISEAELGLKVADFPFDANLVGCDMNAQFTDQQFIFNIAMGGHWAEARWPLSKCEGEIYDTLLNHPETLKEAYWLINGMYLYGSAGGDDAGAPPAAQSPAAQPTTTTTEAPQSSSPAPQPTPTTSEAEPAPTQTPTNKTSTRPLGTVGGGRPRTRTVDPVPTPAGSGQTAPAVEGDGESAGGGEVNVEDSSAEDVGESNEPESNGDDWSNWWEQNNGWRQGRKGKHGWGRHGRHEE